jgi:hypothetical protein
MTFYYIFCAIGYLLHYAHSDLFPKQFILLLLPYEKMVDDVIAKSANDVNVKHEIARGE